MNFTSQIRTEPQFDSETVKKTITTEVIQTEISQSRLAPDQRTRYDFDASARKFIDWMDSIERILDDKQSNRIPAVERQEIIQVRSSLFGSAE